MAAGSEDRDLGYVLEVLNIPKSLRSTPSLLSWVRSTGGDEANAFFLFYTAALAQAALPLLVHPTMVGRPLTAPGCCCCCSSVGIVTVRRQQRLAQRALICRCRR